MANESIPAINNFPHMGIRKAVLSWFAFFATVITLSVGYSAYTALQAVGTASTWSTLSSSEWNKVVANFVSIDSQLQALGSLAFKSSVATDDMANSAVTDSKIATGISPSKLASGSATAGQVLKWSGTAWTPGADNSNASSDALGRKAYTVVMSVASASNCPSGWTLEALGNYNRNGYVYVQITNNGLNISAESGYSAGHEHLNMHYALSNGPAYLCHRTFTTNGRPHISLFAYGTNNASLCPTGDGYHYVPHAQLKGANDWGYFMSNDNGAYLGYVDSWSYGSHTNMNGYIARWWTSSTVNGTCFKVMGVDEDGATKNGVYPVFLGVRNLSTCTDLGYGGMPTSSFGSSRYNYLQYNDSATVFGPMYSWGHGGETYAQVHYHDTHVNNTCWKYYPVGNRQPVIQQRLLATGSCPTGYSQISSTELKGWNDNGYLQQTAFGLYMGWLYSWDVYSLWRGYNRNSWTTQLGTVCMKIDNS